MGTKQNSNNYCKKVHCLILISSLFFFVLDFYLISIVKIELIASAFIHITFQPKEIATCTIMFKLSKGLNNFYLR